MIDIRWFGNPLDQELCSNLWLRERLEQTVQDVWTNESKKRKKRSVPSQLRLNTEESSLLSQSFRLKEGNRVLLQSRLNERSALSRSLPANVLQRRIRSSLSEDLDNTMEGMTDQKKNKQYNDIIFEEENSFQESSLSHLPQNNASPSPLPSYIPNDFMNNLTNANVWKDLGLDSNLTELSMEDQETELNMSTHIFPSTVPPSKGNSRISNSDCFITSNCCK